MIEVAAFSAIILAARNSIAMIKDIGVIAANEEIFKLQNYLLDMQSAYAECQGELHSLQAKNRELEDKLAQQSDWKREAKRYESAEVRPGVVVVRLREGGLKKGEPVIHLCPDCFEQKKKRVLPAGKRGEPRYCGECKQAYLFEDPPGMAMPAAFNRPSRRDNY